MENDTILDGRARLCRGLIKPGHQSNHGSTETEQIQSGPLRELFRPTKESNSVKAGQTQSNQNWRREGKRRK
jgi:hypothetical protein